MNLWRNVYKMVHRDFFQQLLNLLMTFEQNFGFLVWVEYEMWSVTLTVKLILSQLQYRRRSLKLNFSVRYLILSISPLTLTWNVFKDEVSTMQKTHPIFVIKTNQLILYKRYNHYVFPDPCITDICNVCIEFRIIVRIMVGTQNIDSCREYFKRLKILPLQSQYLPSLLPFVAKNFDHFRLNS